MSALVFSNYAIAADEEPIFVVGKIVTLDGIDGFYDQALAACPVGRRLNVLLCDREIWSASDRSDSDPQQFRNQLFRASMVTGTIVETDDMFSAEFGVHHKEPFSDYYRRKPEPATNEVLTEIAYYDDIWASTAQAVRRLGTDYRYFISCRLPPVAVVEQSLQHGLVGIRRPPSHWHVRFLLEPITKGDFTRVIAFGPNDVDSSRIYDITDVAEYRRELATRLANSRLIEETRFWKSLLEN